MTRIPKICRRGSFSWLIIVSAIAVATLVDGRGVRAQDSSKANKLIVAVRDVPPFAVYKDGAWSGIAVALWRDVAAENGWQYEFHRMTLKEMLAASRAGTVDVGVGATTVTSEREKHMDFTHPLHTSGLGMAVADDRPTSWLQVVRGLVSGKLLFFLGSMLAIMVLSGLLVYLFERKGNAAHFGGGFWRGWGNGIWWAVVTMTTVGYGEKTPRSLGGRMVAGVWMLSGLVIVAAFTAVAVAAFTISQQRTDWNGPEDLGHARVATVADSTAADYLDARFILYKGYTSAASALAALQEGKHDVVVYDAPLLQYTVAQKFAGRVRVLPFTFERQDYAIALKNQSPLRESCNQSLLKIIGRDDWQKRLNRFLHKE